MSKSSPMADRKFLRCCESPVSKLTYKDGWQIYVEPADFERSGPSGAVMIAATAIVPDRDGRQPIPIRSQILVREGEDEKMILASIRHMLQNMECHECDEWFKWNGERVNDPHPRIVPELKFEFKDAKPDMGDFLDSMRYYASSRYYASTWKGISDVD